MQKNKARNINLFLMDGTPNGRVKCSISNWTGLAYKIPRTELENCKDRSDLLKSGVYFLFGSDDESGQNLVYVGQAGSRKNGDGILSRLLEHKRNPDKGYWSEAVVLTTSNNSFGPTEISYLENQFCLLAKNTARYSVKNGNEPHLGNITEEKESELEEFLENAKLVVGVLGHKVFEPIIATEMLDEDDIPNQESVKLNIIVKQKGVNIIEAHGKQTSEGFVVLKGSKISEITANSLSHLISELRNSVIKDSEGRILENMLFKSPSAAAQFVKGYTVNGLMEWKTENGVTLKDLEQVRINDVVTKEEEQTA